MNCDRIDSITPERFANLLAEYKNTIPSRLQVLNDQRYEILPKQIEQRKDQQHVTKAELMTLVDWKLAHGKFRPSLKNLIAQNAPEDITQASMAALAKFSSHDFPRHDRLAAAITSLTPLRGVGPATASLVLATSNLHDACFFSDQLYWWTLCDAPNPDMKRDWSRKIRYDMKEYLQIDSQVSKLRFRLGVTCADVEKVADVLFKYHEQNQNVPLPAQTSNGKVRKRGIDERAFDKTKTRQRTIGRTEGGDDHVPGAESSSSEPRRSTRNPKKTR